MQNCPSPATPAVATPPQMDPLTWRVHPARQRPWAALLTTLAIVAMAVSCALTGGVFWGVLAIVVLVGSLGRFYFPSRFTLDQEGVTAHSLLGPRRLAWARIRRFSYDGQGAYLSARARPSRWDAYGGVHLLFGSWRKEVLAAIRSRLSAGGGAP